MDTPIKPEIYKNLPLKKLIIFCIRNIVEAGGECTFERLVKECFDMFPESFSFYRYPQWPDSLKLDRHIRELRTPDGYVTGSNETRFLLTREGLEFSDAVAKELNTPVLNRVPKTGGRKEERLLEEIRSTKEFEEYSKSGRVSVPSESRIRDLAQATLETSHERVVEHLDHLGEISEAANDTELSEFLKRCKEVIING